MRLKSKYGFTLVELLIVIAIFALIANFTMVSLNNARRKSRDAKRMSDIAQLRNALHLYSVNGNGFPAGDGLPLGSSNYLILNGNGWGINTTAPVFMFNVPRDPQMVNDTASACTDSSSSPCDYGYYQNGNDFVIYFYLEGDVEQMPAGLHAATKDSVL